MNEWMKNKWIVWKEGEGEKYEDNIGISLQVGQGLINAASFSFFI